MTGKLILMDRAANAITNALNCIEYARRPGCPDDQRETALDNARQALDYAAKNDPTGPQQAVIASILRRLDTGITRLRRI